MISLKDINKAIIEQVKISAFPNIVKLDKLTINEVDAITMQIMFASTDIRESITRPSFYAEFGNNRTGKFNKNNKERTVTVKLYYFASDPKKHKLENLEIQELLEEIFIDGLVTDDFIIEILKLEFDTIDSVLVCEMELYTIEDIRPNEDHIESMENIEVKI
jgi:hypothetical protein